MLGLASFAGVVAVTLRQVARARRRSLGVRADLTRLTTGFAMAIIVYLTTGLFLHFAYIRYFWLMMALAAAAGRIAEQELARAPAPTAAISTEQPA